MPERAIEAAKKLRFQRPRKRPFSRAKERKKDVVVVNRVVGFAVAFSAVIELARRLALRGLARGGRVFSCMAWHPRK